jgi:HNH endonuclease
VIHVQKNDGVYLWVGKNNRVRRARKAYENTYGEIPRGYVIYHKDENNSNDHPSNLVAISRAELVKRNAAKKFKNYFRPFAK